jgi:DNA-binding transcriptional LysR family regulator
MRSDNLVALEAVLAIARKKSFRGAAVEIGMSTTAVSTTIGNLERHLGVRLFNRTTRSVSLTDAGQNFVAQVAPALRDIRDAMDGARSQQDTPSGVLRINAFAAGAREVMAPLIVKYLRAYPQVHIDLVTEGKLVDVVAEGFDFGIRRADLVPSDMVAVTLGRPRRYAVVASPKYLEAHGRPRVPADLREHSCIRVRLPNGALYPWELEKDGKPARIDVTGRLTLDEASLSRIAVLEHLGLGFFMESDVRDDIEAGRLVRVLTGWTPPLAPLALYYPGRKNPSAAFRLFVDMARAFTKAK